MPIPTKLQQIVQDLRAEVLQDAHHNLFPNQRLPIYDFIKASSVVKTRKWLAVLSAKFVLPSWEREMPNWDLAQKTIELAQKVLLEELNAKEMPKKSTITSLIANLAGIECGRQADYAMEAAITALAEVRGINLFKRISSLQIKQGIPDEMISSLYVDTMSAAVCAYSGVSFDWKSLPYGNANDPVYMPKLIAHVRNTFDPKFDPNKRLEFWEWWLTEAIPHAWELAQQSSAS